MSKSVNYRTGWIDSQEQELLDTIATNGTNRYKTKRLHVVTEESMKKYYQFRRFIGLDGYFNAEDLKNMTGMEEYMRQWSEARRYIVFYKKENGKTGLFHYDRDTRFNADPTKPIKPVKIDPMSLNIEEYDRCSFDGKTLLRVMKLMEFFMNHTPGLQFYIVDWTVQRHIAVNYYLPTLTAWQASAKNLEKTPFPAGWAGNIESLNQYRIVAVYGAKGAWKFRANYYEALRNVKVKDWPEKLAVIRFSKPQKAVS